MNDRLLRALWAVRNGGSGDYQDGINFGVVLGMACTLPYNQHCNVDVLLLNASDYARMDWKQRRTEARI
ncbi:hypothetical protein D9M69_686830 [compost metagenome]